jgi:type VII secretion-associated serine protease mycosin
MVTSTPWAQQLLAPQRVWPLTTGGHVTVAVIDTGVDARVPQLAGHVLPGVDVVDGSGTADTDCNGHGTMVAGIVAGQPATTNPFVGVAPGATILPIRQSTDSADGKGSAEVLAQAIRTAADAGAQVINVSLVTTVPNTDVQAAVAYAQAKGAVIVAAAGNDAQQGDPVTYPAAYPGVLAVGSIDSDGQPSAFSETGSFVGVAAPGGQVDSLYPGGPGQVEDSGTSFAAPFVAGVAALVRSYRPNLTPAQVVHRIVATADHPGAQVPDPALGYGVVDPYTAVTALLPGEGGAAVPVAVKATPVALPAEGVAATSRRGPLLAAAGAATLTLLLVMVGIVVPRGRRARARPSA